MSEMVKVVLNGQFELLIPKHRADRPEWYTEKGWEKKRLLNMYAHLKLSKRLRPKEVVYYIGAEEGEMAALCQIWGADVVLFEPNDKVWANIKAIWDANNLEYPLYCFSGFASNKNTLNSEGYFKKRSFPDSANGEVIGDHGFKELKDPGDIPQVKIDTVVEVTGVIPTAISLDVEGSEWEVLRGAEKTLKEHKPRIWLSLHPEFLHEQYGEWGAELRRWIMDLGYSETLLDYPLHEVHLYYE